MNKLFPKLVSVVLILIISLLMVVMSTYAWVTMSGSPEVGGITITIGGLDTILIAPDISAVSGESTVHYPGAFKDKINFSRVDGYEYLDDLVGLAPFSTADGIHWFSADYAEFDGSDDSGAGQLVSVGELPMDKLLTGANLTQLPDDGSVSGCYVYLDFWVVSPMDECVLRVSKGDNGSGSYVVDLKDVAGIDEDDDGSPDTYRLDGEKMPISASARVGFLVNTDKIEDSSMEKYVRSESYSEQFHYLLGNYQMPGEEYYGVTDFTIYEPNADFHTDSMSYVSTLNGVLSRVYNEGSYVVTKPVGLVNGVPTLVDISDRLTVQTTSRWNAAPTADEDIIDQVFQAYYLSKADKGLDSASLFNGFYCEYLQYQYSSYISAGSFIKNTPDLYSACSNGTVEKYDLEKLATAGATDTAPIVTLYKNVPQKIRMFVWIEGQDADCVNSASGSSFTVNLELAGSTD